MATAFESRKAVEFYTIELAQLADGTFRVSVIATTVDDEEPQLLSQELVTERAASLDDALSLIKTSMAT
jgi:hypothetical protein